MKIFVSLMLLLCLISPVHAEPSPWKANWIWNGAPRKDNYFRKVITATGNPTQAKLAITADNVYELYVNGNKIGSDDDWMNLEVYDISEYIHDGPNIIAVKGTDIDTAVGGLLLEGAFAYTRGKATIFGTDGTWKISGTEAPGWTAMDFDDALWQTPKVIGKPPAGAWGGIDHPALVPKTPLRVVSVTCPKEVKQGTAFTAVAEVEPEAEISFDSPVGLQLLIGDEPAFEKWIDPKAPTSSWTPGEVQTLTFKDVRLPLYIPSGRLRFRVVTNATDSTGAYDVQVGPPAKAPAVPQVAVTSLSVRAVNGGKGLLVSAQTKGAPKNASYLFTLFKDKDMWFAQNISAGTSTKIQLPQGFPGGRYEANLLPHKMQCISSPLVSVMIPGPESTALRPLGYGTYTDRDNVPHRWYVNTFGAMIWDGQPYIPIGGMYLSRFFGDYRLGSPANNEKQYKDEIQRLTALKKSGVTDIYLNPCTRWEGKPVWVWQRWADICEQVGINYGIQITNNPRRTKSFNIAQDEYLVSIKGGETAKATMPIEGEHKIAEKSAYYAAFDVETDKVLDIGKAVLKDALTGIDMEATPRVDAGREVNVHFIPENNEGVFDYWQGLNDIEEGAKRFFGVMKLGPNFRLWIDPLDNEQGFGGKPTLPDTDAFRSMFAEYLKSSYQAPADVAKAWAVTDAQGLDYAAFARMLPLGKPRKDADIGYTLDNVTGKTYRVDLTKSSMWYDVLHFRDASVNDADCWAADMVKSYHDAPVVLKGTGTNIFTNLHTHGGFDGIGMEAYSSAPELVRGCGGGVFARCKMSNHTMWTLTTETGFCEEFCGYPDPIRLTKELGSMLEMNGKGTFYFLLDTPGEDGWKIFNISSDPRQLIWMGAYAKLAKSSKLLPYYEPEVDYSFPCMVEGQGTGFAPCDPGFHGDGPSQSVPGKSGRWVVNASTQVPAEAGRVIANLENDPATSIYGSQFRDVLAKHEVVMVGYRKNLGALPVDSYYTDKFVKDSDGLMVQALKPTPTSKVFARTPGGTVYGLTDGRLTIYAKEGWKASVSKMASKRQDVDFYKDVLGLQMLDLGRAFQGMHFGSTTYIWNVLDSKNSLMLDVPAGAKDVVISFADGTSKKIMKPGRVVLPLPTRAEQPVIIETLSNANISGVDKANLAAGMALWQTAASKAKSLGFTLPPKPVSSDWHKVFRQADQLMAKANEGYRTATAVKMAGVNVDGDLSEWRNAKPIFMTMFVKPDYTIPQAYSGARFYTGYDDKYIYVAGDVNDEAIVNNYLLDNLWNGDAFEVLLDLHPNVDPGKEEYNADCFQFIFAPVDKSGKPAVAVKNTALPPDSVPQRTQWAVKRRNGGWQLEAAISRADINSFQIKPGGEVGFTIQLDDSDGGDRASTRLWRGKSDASRNRLGLGRLVFKSGN